MLGTEEEKEGGVLQEVQELISCVICWSAAAADAIRLTCRRRSDSCYHKLPSSHNNTLLFLFSALHPSILPLHNKFVMVILRLLTWLCVHRVTSTLCSLLKWKMLSVSTHIYSSEKLRWQNNMTAVWWVPPNSCKQISTTEDVFQRCKSAVPFFTPSLHLPFFPPLLLFAPPYGSP